LGTTIAPFIGSALILAVVEQGVSAAEETLVVQNMYLGLTVILFALAAIIISIRLPVIHNIEKTDEPEASSSEVEKSHKSAWGFPHLVLGAVGIFVYVGAEVSIGSFLVKFFALPEIAGLNESAAGNMIAYYWGGTMAGRFIGAAIMQKVKPGKILKFNALIAAGLVIITMLVSGKLAMYSILLVGLFNSIMFPTIFTLAINKLGIHTPHGSGILCMAIVGGAVIPLIQGIIADSGMGLHRSFILPVLCYMYIAYYGWKGHRVRESGSKQ
jgi:FHS family L-fucose permease-like MFS transporter